MATVTLVYIREPTWAQMDLLWGLWALGPLGPWDLWNLMGPVEPLALWDLWDLGPLGPGEPTPTRVELYNSTLGKTI